MLSQDSMRFMPHLLNILESIRVKDLETLRTSRRHSRAEQSALTRVEEKEGSDKLEQGCRLRKPSRSPNASN